MPLSLRKTCLLLVNMEANDTKDCSPLQYNSYGWFARWVGRRSFVFDCITLWFTSRSWTEFDGAKHNAGLPATEVNGCPSTDRHFTCKQQSKKITVTSSATWGIGMWCDLCRQSRLLHFETINISLIVLQTSSACQVTAFRTDRLVPH